MKVMSGSLRMPVAAAFATITASICLGPVFLIGSWFLPTAFGVLVVGAGCEVARRLSASRSTVPLGGLAALALYLLWRYGNDEALLGVIPTSGSVDHLGKLATAGREDINQYAAPIGVSPGIEMLTVAGVGLIALAVDTLAVTWRRAALAGLPLLVLYTVPTAVAPEGVSWVAFAIAGIAFLTLLLAESRERVSRWGRPMRFSVARENWQPDVDPSPLGQVGRRVGATALGLALVVPAVLPEFNVSSIGFGSGGFGRGGGGDPVAVFNPIIDLGDNLRQGDDTPVIRYSGKPTYLRMVGLDQFTGAKWQPSSLEVSRNDNDAEDGLPLPPGLGGATERHLRHYSIEIFDFSQAWLPLPYPTRKVSDIDGTWLYDPATFNVFGENSSTRQISYKVTALDVTYDPESLRTAGPAPSSLRKYLQVPRDLDPRVLAQAREVTTGQPTAYDQALALQTWLRDPNEFTYNQTVDASVGDGNGSQAILAFLQTRQGYCVHFASTMAVMARQLGIPARVAVGFALGHTVQGKQVVGLHELHAWPELYFQGSGWVPFEPTPGGPASQPPSWARVAPGGDQSTAAPTGGRPRGRPRPPGCPAARTVTGRTSSTSPPRTGGAVWAPDRSGSRCSPSCSRWLPWCCSRCRRSPGCWCAGAAGGTRAHRPSRRSPPGPSCTTRWSTTATTGIPPTRRGAGRPGWWPRGTCRASRPRRWTGWPARSSGRGTHPRCQRSATCGPTWTRCGQRCPTARAGGSAGGPGCCRGRPARCPRRWRRRRPTRWTRSTGGWPGSPCGCACAAPEHPNR